MPSLKFTVLGAAAALFSLVRADYSIDPDSVPLGTRKQWCTTETSTCPLICEQTEPFNTLVNTCDPVTLTYGCICGNNLQPNISEYSLTLPFFVCQEWGNQCVTGCGSDDECSSDCRTNHPCGALNPTRVNTTSSASGTATATATGSDSATSAAGKVFGDGGTTTTAGSSGATATGSSQKSFAAPRFEAGRALMGSLLTMGGLAAGAALIL